MLGSNRGFTIVQLIVAMTVAGLIVIWIGVGVAQKSWRNGQRRHDLGVVDAAIEQYPQNHLGQYPKTVEADAPGSDLQLLFNALRLVDPGTSKYYILGSDFGDCNGATDGSVLGVGYVSYERPGDNGKPFKLRICLEGGGEYYFGD